MDLENQPGTLKPSNGPGPSILSYSLMLRPQNLRLEVVVYFVTKTKRVFQSEIAPKTDNSSKMTRSGRSTSVNAIGMVSITTSNTGGQ